MFLFISGAVNNDNLAILLASLAVFLMIRAVNKKISWRNWSYWLLLGVVIGLALLTKEGTFGLLPLAWGTGFVSRLANISPKQPQPNLVQPCVGCCDYWRNRF